MVRELYNRIRGLFTKGTVISHEGNEIVVNLGHGYKQKMRALTPYGLSFVAPKDAQVLTVSLGGERENTLALVVDDPRYKVELSEGNVALSNKNGDVIKLEDGQITVTAKSKVVVHSPEVELGENAKTPIQGVLNGETVDPFTGQTHFVLGNASSKVRAKK